MRALVRILLSAGATAEPAYTSYRDSLISGEWGETDTFMQRLGTATGDPCHWKEADQADVRSLRVAVANGCEGCRAACTGSQLREWADCKAIECGTGYCVAFDREPRPAPHTAALAAPAPLGPGSESLPSGVAPGERPADLQCLRKVSLTFHQIGGSDARCVWGGEASSTEARTRSSARACRDSNSSPGVRLTRPCL